MSVNAGVESQGQTQNTEPVTGQQTQGQQPPDNTQQQQQIQSQQQNQPAPYAPYLERVPESVRTLVEPVFKDWDAGVTQRFQQLHSQYQQQYGWAEPWQEFAQQYEPDTVAQSLQLLEALSTDPQGFYQALGETYGLTAQQAQQVVEQGQPGQQQQQGQQQIEDPRYTQLEQIVGTLAQTMQQQQQAEIEAREEQEFFSELNRLSQVHGEFDGDYVIAKIAAGMQPEQAVLSYRALVGQQAQQLIAPGQQAPVVMGSGGGVPTQSIDPKSLDRKTTQDLVANVLAANKQG